MLEASHRYFHRAADLFDLDQKLRSILLTPNRIVKATGAVPTREACAITPRWTRTTP
jgi:hypothetical protein